MRNGVIKIVIGLLMMFGGAMGFIFGRSAKERWVRVVVYVVSGILVFGGLYVFVLGVEELAVGQFGNYRLGGPRIQGMVYDGPEDFAEKLGRRLDGRRRIVYRCPDGSEAFVVYNTGLGVYGIPSGDVKCGEFKLLEYRTGK